MGLVPIQLNERQAVDPSHLVNNSAAVPPLTDSIYRQSWSENLAAIQRRAVSAEALPDPPCRRHQAGSRCPVVYFCMRDPCHSPRKARACSWTQWTAHSNDDERSQKSPDNRIYICLFTLIDTRLAIVVVVNSGRLEWAN